MKDHMQRQERNVILPQMVIETLYELTKGDAYITTGVGQHQMWAGQWYKYKFPRQFITSAGLGSMGYGFPAALGVKVAFPRQAGHRHRWRRLVPDEHPGTRHRPRREDRRQSDHPEQPAPRHGGAMGRQLLRRQPRHTYLGNPTIVRAIYPDYVRVCNSFGVKCERVIYKKDLRAAIQRMLDSDEAYVLDVVVPYSEHVIPFIPAGKHRRRHDLEMERDAGRRKLRPSESAYQISITVISGRTIEPEIQIETSPTRRPHRGDRISS
jgi:acetolactate synthase-1/2/3 large subunit